MRCNPKLKSMAGKQQGYFTSQQAVDAGYPRNLQTYHTQRGHWLRIERGLYRLPELPDSPESAFVRWSLWLAGKSPRSLSAVSHESALRYYSLSPAPAEPVHLTICGSCRRFSAAGVMLHWAALDDCDYRQHPGFQITSPVRTLQDMKPDLLYRRQWRQTLEHALARGLLCAAEYRNLSEESRSVRGEPPLTGSNRELRSEATTGDLPAGVPGGRYRFGGSISQRRQAWQHSFTLIEMLVVIAILSILSALLLPALQSAVGSARATACVNTNKQIGTMLSCYADDHRGRIVTVNADYGMTWHLPYLQGTRYGYTGGGYLESYRSTLCAECPSSRYAYETAIGAIHLPVGVNERFTYVNSGITASFTMLRLSGFLSPSDTAIWGDACQWWSPYSPHFFRFYRDGVGLVHSALTAGMLFGDGHAAQMSSADLLDCKAIAAHFSFASDPSALPFRAGYDKTGQRVF